MRQRGREGGEGYLSAVLEEPLEAELEATKRSSFNLSISIRREVTRSR
jgi:hypothetical protein